MQSIVFCILVMIGILGRTSAIGEESKTMQLIKKVLQFRGPEMKNIAFSPIVLEGFLTQMALASSLCSPSFKEISLHMEEEFWFRNPVDFKNLREKIPTNSVMWSNIYTTDNLPEDYTKFIKQYYQSLTFVLDDFIRSLWKNLINENTKLLIKSVFTFSIDRELQFGEKEASFLKEDGKKDVAYYRYITGEFFHEDKKDGLKIVKLPVSENFDMLILLPEINQLDQLIDRLSENNIKKWHGISEKKTLEIYLLRNIIMTLNAKDVLTSLGTKSFFENHSSKFGNITTESFEAFFTTTLNYQSFAPERFEGESLEFKADRPHLVLILEKNTSKILLISKITIPTN